MSSNLKSPPTFKAEGDDYLSWKTDLEVWELYTDLEKKKRGPPVYLQLEGKARDAVRELKPEDIAKDTGLQSIMDKLDEVYLKDKNTSYTAFKEFYEYKRSSGEKYSELWLNSNNYTTRWRNMICAYLRELMHSFCSMLRI